MRMTIQTLDRAGRDTVSSLVIGYEADARSGVPMQDQVDRLTRWRERGWAVLQYHYNILAMLIGYARAKQRTYTLDLPGIGDT